MLDSDHVCREIADYLVHHSEAADTVIGIAEWWINRDVAQTSEAVTKLRAHGVVSSHIVQDTTSVYTLAKSRLIRETLRQYLDQCFADEGRTPLTPLATSAQRTDRTHHTEIG
ncbi:MAG TPA: hypothetical protein VK548_09435 [Candidatus Acidoferrum sp.]|nr:hypothetical protein [Candidatus Acidoferrum sp.]